MVGMVRLGEARTIMVLFWVSRRKGARLFVLGSENWDFAFSTVELAGMGLT